MTTMMNTGMSLANRFNRVAQLQSKPMVHFSGRTDEPQEEDAPDWIYEVRINTLIEKHFSDKDPEQVKAAFEAEMSEAGITTNSAKIEYLTAMEAELSGEGEDTDTDVTSLDFFA